MGRRCFDLRVRGRNKPLCISCAAAGLSAVPRAAAADGGSGPKRRGAHSRALCLLVARVR
eukprot:12314142-Alexandrium_andersonii.AAC.1